MAIEHDELADLVPALVLGSVTPAEREQLLHHLEGCPSCRSLAATLARGAAALAIEPEPVEPPAGLHGRVLAAVAAARQDARPRASRRSVSLLPRSRALRLGLGRVPLRLAAAACAFILGAGVGLGIGHLRAPSAPSSPVTSSDVARYPLHGSGSMAGVSATAVSLKRDGVTLIDFKDMPQLSADQVYELWLITADGRALPAAVFVPDAQGSKVVLVTQDLKGGKQLAVTVEHGPGGASTPSQRPQLAGSIA